MGLEVYEKLLDPILVTLNWVYDTTHTFFMYAFGYGMKQKDYHVDVHSVRLSVQLWRSRHALIGQHNDNPLPLCKYIAPSGI